MGLTGVAECLKHGWACRRPSANSLAQNCGTLLSVVCVYAVLYGFPYLLLTLTGTIMIFFHVKGAKLEAA